LILALQSALRNLLSRVPLRRLGPSVRQLPDEITHNNNHKPYCRLGVQSHTAYESSHGTVASR